jgi:mRNA interferase RelE/StbE
VAHTVEFLRTAAEELAALPKADQRRIAAKIDTLRDNPRPPWVKELVAEQTLYRLRVGDFRVIYSIDDKKLVVLVIRIGHRRDVYRER